MEKRTRIVKEEQRINRFYKKKYAIALYDSSDEIVACFNNIYEMASAYHLDYESLMVRFSASTIRGCHSLRIDGKKYKYYLIDMVKEEYKEMDKIDKEAPRLVVNEQDDEQLQAIEQNGVKKGDYFFIDVIEFINEKKKEKSNTQRSYRYDDFTSARRNYLNYKRSDVVAYCNIRQVRM